MRSSGHDYWLGTAGGSAGARIDRGVDEGAGLSDFKGWRACLATARSVSLLDKEFFNSRHANASITLVIAGCFRFFIFSQCLDAQPVQASKRSLSRVCNATTIKRDRKPCERDADCSTNDFAHSIHYPRVAIRRKQLRYRKQNRAS